MATKKGKGKGKKGGKKCLVALAVPLALAGCKSVPVIDDDGEPVMDDRGEPVVEQVPDYEAIDATGTAISTLLPPPWNLVAGAIFGSGAVGAGIAAYRQGRKKGEQSRG